MPYSLWLYREEREADVTDRTKVTIFEVAHRPWGELRTSAEVDDRVYVGSRERRALHPQEWKALQDRMKRA
jgi:hypothetical protein